MRLRLAGRPTTHSTYVPTGRIWPSGDFSVGYRRVEGDKYARIDTRSEAQRIDDGDYANLPDDWEYLGNGRTQKMVGSLTASEKMACDEWHGGDGPLTLANVPNSHSAFYVGYRPVVALTLAPWLAYGSHRSVPQRGLKGMTGHGKKMVRSAATLIQRRHGASRTTFCTVSMPTLPSAKRRELAEQWPELVRQFLQFLTRRLESKGLPRVVCSVTEIQPKRLEGYGESYLHLHLVWGNHWARRGNWAISANECRDWLEAFMQRRGLWESDSWVRVNVQPVKKSAAGYLAKYMSKGASEIADMAEDVGWAAIPRQWWNLTKDARDWVKSELLQGDEVGAFLLATVGAIFRHVVPFAEVFYSLHEVMMEIDGRSVGVGWRGSCLESFRKELKQTLDMARAS